MNKWVSTSIISLTVLVIQGCTTVENTAKTSDSSLYIEQTSDTVLDQPLPELFYRKPPQPDTPQFPIDTLYSLLVAEVAASRQQFDTTLDNYVEQAKVIHDPQIIARAARIAQFFKSKQESLDMGLLWLKHQPNDREAITLVANAYIELKQPLIALDYTEQLFSVTEPEDYPSVAALTETIANFSKPASQQTLELLIQRFTKLQNSYPKLTSIKVGLSILHQSQNDLVQARHWIDQALKQEPDHTTAVIQDILLLQQNQQTELAIIRLKNQLNKDPSNGRLRLIYARLLTQTDIEEAYRQFTQLSEQAPNQLDLKFSRALIATELRKTVIATPLFEELLEADYRPNTSHFYLGHLAELTQREEQALKHYLKVESGENLLAAKSRAGRLLIKQQQTDKARQLFTQLRLDFPARKEDIYTNESDALIGAKSFDQALSLLDEAIEQFPDNSSLRYNRSTIYEKQDKLALMESDLRHVLTIDPNNVSALNGLGYFLVTRTERYEEALELINKALTLRPEDAAVIDSMGWVVFKLGRIKEAIRYLEKAFSIFPDPEVAAHLGEALWVDGDKQQAKDILRENLQKHPDSPQIIETIQRLGISL